MRPKPFERVCGVCRDKKNKFELVRLCKQNGEIKIDKEFSLGGKGVYICKNCVQNLDKNKGLNKAFKSNISKEVSDEIVKRLKEI